MTISIRNKNSFISRLISITKLQKFKHTMANEGLHTSDSNQGEIDISMWRKANSRAYGITRSMISPPSWSVLQILRSEGFEAYLVGGCVRDLLLKRIPKDFDVITTAKLKQIKKQFHRAHIVGQRFPICRVNIKGSVIEVSSFETVAKHSENSKEGIVAQMPKGCDEKDVLRWRNSMHRDFTINSLFYDPFKDRIYDYANGMMDLRSLKLRTLIPAQLSFKEDSARILRGLRLAARLSFSLSKETEAAIRSLSSSIQTLDKSRIMMELNYMLSYGAAEPSLSLLRRFKILEILFPFHAAYLDQQASKGSEQGPIMLMKLFFSLDKLFGCDRPSHCSLWVGLLAFHQALVSNPQHALVVWTFSSVLYHGNWDEGAKFGREQAEVLVSFSPEISEPCGYMSDEELKEKVTHLASLVQASVDALMETDSLAESMSKFPISPFSGLVFVSKKTGNDVVKIFNVLVNDIESYNEGRQDFRIDYHLLGKGDFSEIRFVLAKVILDTMSGGIVQEATKVQKNGLHTSNDDQKLYAANENRSPALSDFIEELGAVMDVGKQRPAPSKSEQHRARSEKRQLVEKCNNQGLNKKNLKAGENMDCQESTKGHEVVENLITQEKPKKHEEVKNVIDNTTKKQQQVGEISGKSLERNESEVPGSNKHYIDENVNDKAKAKKNLKDVENNNLYTLQDTKPEKRLKMAKNQYLQVKEMIKQGKTLAKSRPAQVKNVPQPQKVLGKTCDLPQQEVTKEKNEQTHGPFRLSSLFK